MANNRVFGYALAFSAALHAAALLLFPELIDSARRAVQFPPPIIARLLAPAPAPAPAPPPIEKKEPAATRAPIEKKEKVEEKVDEKVQQPAAPALEPIPAPVPVPAPPTVEAPVIAAPSPAAPPPAAPAPAGVAALEPRSAPAEAPEALSRDQYRLQLLDEARRHKRYPPLARENNWQGDVRVAVVVGANGRAAVSLKASSGYEVLDRQALEMFSTAARAVPVPAPLRGRAFALELRAVYGLED